MSLLKEIRKQRWDDHRFYHQNRINQTLHLWSSICFAISYVWLFFDPVMAMLFGWLIGQVPRQAGHFFFESKGYDKVNDTTHEYKESIKPGYNLKRKLVMLSIWIGGSIALYLQPSLWGMLSEEQVANGFEHNLGIYWLAVAVGALLFRTVQLMLTVNVTHGLAWFFKILTDPFHDMMIYYKAPYHLIKGNMMDDMSEWYDPTLKTGVQDS